MHRPIFILGAARSGTKMLRGILAAHPDVSVVPWDVNFMWKYGNYNVPHDELTVSQLRPEVRRFLERGFRRFVRPGTHRLVEKTVSNTLRAEFVRAAFPDCIFVHLVRDGRAVAESARRMWLAPMEVRAVLEKIRAFPPRAVPTYGVQYVRSYAERRLGLRGGSVRSWGPRWKNIDEDVRSHELIEVCALQWVHSIDRTRRALQGMPDSCWSEVRYERLVAEPAVEVARLLDFLRLPVAEEVNVHLAQAITAAHTEKWRSALTKEELEGALRHEGRLLAELGYT